MRKIFGARVEERHVVLTENAIYVSKVLVTSACPRKEKRDSTVHPRLIGVRVFV